MRELLKSMSGFSWAMSMFGAEQASRLFKPGERTAAAAFDSVAKAAQEQLGGLTSRVFAGGMDMIGGSTIGMGSPARAPGEARCGRPPFGRDTYKRGAEQQDFDLLSLAFVDDVQAYIPAGPEPVVGKENLLDFFHILYPNLENLQFVDELNSPMGRAEIFTATVPGSDQNPSVGLEGCDLLYFNAYDQIYRIDAMVRPIQALEALLNLGVGKDLLPG